MFSLSAHYQGGRRVALGVVMIAVLFLCAIQVVEASHLHTSSEVSADCILSGGFTDAAVSNASLTAAFCAVAVPPSEPRLLPCLVRTVVLPPSRGPPFYS